MRFEEYARHDGLGLAALVKAGEVTPLELVEAAIEGIEAHNGVLNARRSATPEETRPEHWTMRSECSEKARTRRRPPAPSIPKAPQRSRC